MTPYIDAATGTHFNKLGIRNRDNLHQVEYAVTDLRIAELMVKPIPGRFDLDHLKQVHAHVFQDLYEWADKERTLNFSKRDAVSRAVHHAGALRRLQPLHHRPVHRVGHVRVEARAGR